MMNIIKTQLCTFFFNDLIAFLECLSPKGCMRLSRPTLYYADLRRVSQADQENRGVACSGFRLLGILQRGLAWPQMMGQKSQLLPSLRRDPWPHRGGAYSGEQSAGFS